MSRRRNHVRPGAAGWRTHWERIDPDLRQIVLEGFGINQDHVDGDDAAHAACSLGLPRILAGLADAGVDVTARTLWSSLATGIDPDDLSHEVPGWVPDRVGCARVLLDHGSDIHAGVSTDDPHGTDPLFIAIDHNQHALAAFLLDHGGNPWSSRGWSAVTIVARRREELFEQLLTATPDPVLRSEVQLAMAALTGDRERVVELMNRGVRADTPLFREGFPNFLAIRSGHLDVARQLISSGADISGSRARKQVLAVIFANGHQSLLPWLAGRKGGHGYRPPAIVADEDSVDDAIHEAIRGDCIASLDWLTDHGAVYRIQDLTAAREMEAEDEIIREIHGWLLGHPDADIWWKAGRSPGNDRRFWWV